MKILVNGIGQAASSRSPPCDKRAEYHETKYQNVNESEVQASQLTVIQSKLCYLVCANVICFDTEILFRKEVSSVTCDQCTWRRRYQ